MAEVGSGRVPSLERVTTGIGSASGAETRKLNSLGTSSQPSWLGLSVSIALLSNTGFSALEIPKYSGADSLLWIIQFLLQYKANFAFTNRIWRGGRRNESETVLLQLFSTELDSKRRQQLERTIPMRSALGVENFSTP